MDKVEMLILVGSGKSSTIHWFMRLLQESIGGTMIFPKLRVFHADYLNFKRSLRQISPALQQRQDGGKIEVVLRWCYHVTSVDVDRLERVALVDWDGIVMEKEERVVVLERKYRDVTPLRCPFWDPDSSEDSESDDAELTQPENEGDGDSQESETTDRDSNPGEE
ncbi:hypothetical protein NM688_g1496 [Phlebia brevispora]|uniref:Uncharacterized protein n=1 Tax=Phlebia brevispora TaxID=194682 RepID=A0ACC1TB07_9APHY|nr:hypothetical protein NM688_g1496 [Phlebia brevispora]